MSGAWPVQPFGVSGASANNSFVRLDTHGRPHRHARGHGSFFVSGGQRQASGEHGKTKNRRLAELTDEHWKKARAEKEKRQRIPQSHRLYTEPSNSADKSEPPRDIREPKNGSALEKNARPFAFREEKSAVTGEKFRAGVRADPESVPKKRRFPVNEKSILEACQDSGDESTGH